MTCREGNVFSAADTLAMQQAQYRHDKLNHCDIANLHKGERLKHYGLHFCKYVGRLARGEEETKPIERTIVDMMLVSLSAANTLAQKLGDTSTRFVGFDRHNDTLRPLADAVGRFADACEKFDHLEDVTAIARIANSDIFAWTVACADHHGIDLQAGLSARRAELANRAFYAQG